MSNFIVFIFLLLPAIFSTGCHRESQQSAEKIAETPPELEFSIGTNLGYIVDWSSGFAFADAFKHAREWVSLGPNKWGDGRKIFTDDNGWVKFLAFEQRAATLLFTGINGLYPDGIYTLRYKGKGKFKFSGNGFGGVISEKPGETRIQLNAQLGGLILEITETDPKDYLRKIQFFFPGGACSNDKSEFCDATHSCSSEAKCLKFTENTDQIIFHPYFLKNISIYSNLRFMDWMRTNNSKISAWSERPKINDYSWGTENGVPAEVMIELSNLTNKTPWFCMPHLAEDNYIKKFAKLVEKSLRPELKVFLEYSNEVWNGLFEQSNYAEKVGREIAESKRPKEEYYSVRSGQIFGIWDEVFQNPDRVVNVVSAQAASISVAEKILENSSQADALAIAPYFAFDFEINTESLDTITLNQQRDWIRKHKELADKYELALISYEGGQHLVPGKEQSKIALAKSLNRSLKMEELYKKYLEIWKNEGGGLFNHFSSIGQCSAYGCWGAKESYIEPDELSPKYRILKSFSKIK